MLFFLNLKKNLPDLVCPLEIGREDCGFNGIDQQKCEEDGCIWCPPESEGKWNIMFVLQFSKSLLETSMKK